MTQSDGEVVKVKGCSGATCLHVHKCYTYFDGDDDDDDYEAGKFVSPSSAAKGVINRNEKPLTCPDAH